jgi:2'-5' RNA ligase
MLPSDRLICAFVEKQPAGYIFKDWPKHITIVPWFRLPISSVQLAEQLQKQYTGLKAFRVAVLDEKQFGYKERKAVNLVSAPELKIIEVRTRYLLHTYKAWIVDESDNTRRNFRPHVTVQNSGRVNKGDSFCCDSLYIVFQHGDYKQIDNVVLLFSK